MNLHYMQFVPTLYELQNAEQWLKLSLYLARLHSSMSIHDICTQQRLRPACEDAQAHLILNLCCLHMHFASLAQIMG